MSQYFSEPQDWSGGNVKVELHLCDYATKADLKGATGIDTFTLVSKTYLANLKTKLDDLDVDKLKTLPSNLSKLSNVVDNDVVKKTVYDQLVTKVNAIGTKIGSTSGLITKTRVNRLVTTTILNTKATEIENKITNVATNAALITKAAKVESKIPDITNLATRAALNKKAIEIENNIHDTTSYMTTPEYNRFSKVHFDARIK